MTQSIPDAELEKDLPDPDLAKVEDEELKKSIPTIVAQKKHWREKANKTAQDFEAYKKANPVNPLPATPPKEVDKDERYDKLSKTVDTLSKSEEKRQFGSRHGYSADDVDEIFAYAQGKGITPLEAKENPFVKIALETLGKQRRAEQNVSRPSSTSVSVGGKTFDQMTSDERKKNLPDIMASALKKK